MIEICSRCEGRGTLTKSELTDYHRREYDTWTIPCKECNGSGRLWVEVARQTQPFKPQKPDREK